MFVAKVYRDLDVFTRETGSKCFKSNLKFWWNKQIITACCIKVHKYEMTLNEKSTMIGLIIQYHIWDKVFKNGPSKISERQPLKNLKVYGLPKQTISLQTF